MSKFPIPEAALRDHIAVLGKTGSGKTSTAKLIVEHVVSEDYRVCILDPIKSDWWGITSSADGKRPGLPFTIIGGPRGHVPLHATSGKVIGELVANGKLPLSILDMALFHPGGHQKFFAEFAETLMRKMRGVVYLVLEEAHFFAPKERAGIEGENMAIYWAKMIATAGRTKGIRFLVVTQRTQALHNALLGSCDTMIVHRFTAPADQEPVQKWLKANIKDKALVAEIDEEMSSLKTGTAWLCSGEAKVFELVSFPRIKTFDNTATPDKDGDTVDVKTAPVDQENLKAIIGDAAQEAVDNDPKTLKAEISRLQAELKKPVLISSPGKDAARNEAAALRDREAAFAGGVRQGHESGYAQGWGDGHKSGFSSGVAAAHGVVKAALTTVASVEYVAGAPPKRLPSPALVHGQHADAVRTAAPARAAPAVQRPSVRATGNGDIHLPPGERAVLIAAAQFDGVEREQLTVLTGYKKSSRNTYIQRLRERGYIEIAGETIHITDEGAAALPPDYEPLPTGEGLQAYWLARLPEGERKMLQELIAAHPASIDRESLGAATGYTKSSRNTYLQRMKAKRLWEADGSAVRASDVLF